MFTYTHNRNVGMNSKWDNVNDVGLGLVVTVTTHFDPDRIKARLYYWLEKTAEEMANQVRQDIRNSGGEPTEGGRAGYRNAAMSKGMSGTSNWSTSTNLPKSPSGIKTYGMMAGKLALSFVVPWVGIGMMAFSMFGKKKKPKIAVPWNVIYSEALPYAQNLTKTEELNRIAEEEQRVQKEREVEVQKVRGRAVEFKLPEGVQSITAGGASVLLVGAAKSFPIVPNVKRK